MNKKLNNRNNNKIKNIIKMINNNKLRKLKNKILLKKKYSLKVKMSKQTGMNQLILLKNQTWHLIFFEESSVMDMSSLHKYNKKVFFQSLEDEIRQLKHNQEQEKPGHFLLASFKIQILEFKRHKLQFYHQQENFQSKFKELFNLLVNILRFKFIALPAEQILVQKKRR